jgi:hypothetical protein
LNLLCALPPWDHMVEPLHDFQLFDRSDRIS